MGYRTVQVGEFVATRCDSNTCAVVVDMGEYGISVSSTREPHNVAFLDSAEEDQLRDLLNERAAARLALQQSVAPDVALVA